MNKLFVTALILAGSVLAVPASALAATESAASQPAASPAASADLSEGEVRKVDKAQGKITIKHGPLKNLDMPSMTMVFGAKDKALLDKVKAGDKVRFKAVDDNGKLFVTEMQKAQ